jgi:hypothetical protein
LIGASNPQPDIRKTSESADWPYRDEATIMYGVGQMMMDRFFNGLVYLDGRKVPDPLIAFDNLRNHKVLAQYDLYPDEYGLMYKITHNTEQYEEVEGKKVNKWGRWAICETQCHEMLHAWQQHGRGKEPYKGGINAHNEEFVMKAKELGLNVTPVIGCHFAVADEGSPFAILMKKLGLPRPADVPKEESKMDWFKFGKEIRGKSSLSKWTCPECKLNVRLGIKGNPEIIHDPCSEKKGEKVFFVRADQPHQTIYKVDDKP